MPETVSVPMPASEPVAKGRGRGYGKPLQKGDDHPNSRKQQMIRKKDLEAKDREIAALRERIEIFETAASDPNADTSPRVMRKVLSQKVEADCGAAEAVLRKWLSQSPKDFIAAIEEKERVLAGIENQAARVKELEAENAALKGSASSGQDVGSAKAREMLVRLRESFLAKKANGAA